ncbi:MAG: transposase family protein, partial [Porphyromonas sp.]|nr:transposase family protein [Porphyromonas sp.]MCI6154801.1 transposase family protein [Porphyromonas sp.]
MKYFETIPDPRVLGRCKYRLCDILFIALATYVC